MHYWEFSVNKYTFRQRGVEMAAAAVAAKGYNRLRACVSASAACVLASAAWVVARLTFV